MARFDIKLTEEAKAAAEALAAEGKDLRFAVTRSGCCSIDGIHILSRDEYPELQWSGTIDYKAKGLHKGFSWK